VKWKRNYSTGGDELLGVTPGIKGSLHIVAVLLSLVSDAIADGWQLDTLGDNGKRRVIIARYG
jgi:hypothetical protein